MQNSPQPANYRTLLAQRGRGFSEPEVTEILRQVLLQLAQLHRQGQAHGSISLETLWQTENRVAVAVPVQPADASFLSRDLYDLGMTAIALLTAQPATVWQNPGSGTSWDDYCTVSDRLLDIINRLVGISPHRFHSADEVLGAIAPSPPPLMVATAPQNYTIPQSMESELSNRQSLPWTKIGVGVAVAGILGAIAIPTFSIKLIAVPTFQTPRIHPKLPQTLWKIESLKSPPNKSCEIIIAILIAVSIASRGIACPPKFRTTPICTPKEYPLLRIGGTP